MDYNSETKGLLCLHKFRVSILCMWHTVSSLFHESLRKLNRCKHKDLRRRLLSVFRFFPLGLILKRTFLVEVTEVFVELSLTNFFWVIQLKEWVLRSFFFCYCLKAFFGHGLFAPQREAKC